MQYTLTEDKELTSKQLQAVKDLDPDRDSTSELRKAINSFVRSYDPKEKKSLLEIAYELDESSPHRAEIIEALLFATPKEKILGFPQDLLGSSDDNKSETGSVVGYASEDNKSVDSEAQRLMFEEDIVGPENDWDLNKTGPIKKAEETSRTTSMNMALGVNAELRLSQIFNPQIQAAHEEIQAAHEEAALLKSIGDNKFGVLDEQEQPKEEATSAVNQTPSPETTIRSPIQRLFNFIGRIF